MIVGPFIGGIITKQFNEQIAAFVAASLSTFSILLVLKLVPKNTKILASCKDSNTQGRHILSRRKGGGKGWQKGDMNPWFPLLHVENRFNQQQQQQHFICII